MGFIMKLNFYGPINKQGIINKVITSSFSDTDLTVPLQKLTTATSANAIPSGNYTYIDSFGRKYSCIRNADSDNKEFTITVMN